MKDRPLLGATIALGTGILLASFWPPGIWLLLTSLSLLTLQYLLTRRLLWARIALLLVFALLGLLRFQQVSMVPANDISRYAPLFITVTGVVDSDVGTIADKTTGAPYAAIFDLDSTHFEIRETNGTERIVPTSGRVSVRIPLAQNPDTHVSRNENRVEPLHYGDTVMVTGRMEIPGGPNNPGAFDSRAYLARKGIYATLTAHRAQDWQRTMEPGFQGNPWKRLAFALRQGVRSHTRRVLSPERAEVLNGVLMGERENLPAALKDDFELTGTTHILATAGLHVGMVVFMLLWLLPRCGIPHRPARLCTLLFLIVYAMMAGGRPSVVRAVLMASIYLIGLLLEREPDLPSAIALAALILLAGNPLELFDAGFQMSFATVITLVAIMPRLQPLRHWLRDNIRGDWPGVNAIRAGTDFLATYFLLALGAQIGAAPLVAYTFHNVSFISVFTNTLVVPVVALLLALGFLASALGGVAPLLALPFDRLLDLLLAYVISVVKFCARLPFANLNLAPPFWMLFLYYGLLAFGLWQWHRWQRQRAPE